MSIFLIAYGIAVLISFIFGCVYVVNLKEEEPEFIFDLPMIGVFLLACMVVFIFPTIYFYESSRRFKKYFDLFFGIWE